MIPRSLYNRGPKDGATSFWESRHFRVGLALVLGVTLAFFLGLLTSDGIWYLQIAVVLVVPVLVLTVRHPFVAIILWMLVYPYFASGLGSVNYWLLYRAMIPGALGISTVYHWLGRGEKKTVRLGTAEWVMVAFLGLGLVNILLLNQDPANAVSRFYDRFVVPFSAYGLIRLAHPDEGDLKLFVGVAFITVLVQSSLALLAWYVPEVVPGRWIGPLQGVRSVGTLRNADVYSSVLVLCGLLLYHCAMNIRSKYLRLLLISAFCLSILAVFFSFSRASWLGCLAVLFGLLWIYPKTTARLLLVLLLVAIILGGTLFTAEVEYAVERLGTEETAEGRLVINDALLQMIAAKPAFGWGFRNYRLYSPEFIRSIGNIPVLNRYDLASHNSYLTLAAEMGLPGLLLYLFPVGWWLALTLKVRRSLPRTGLLSWRLVAVLWLSILQMAIAISFVDLVSYDSFETVLWWISLGLIASMIQPYLNPKGVDNPVAEPSWSPTLGQASRMRLELAARLTCGPELPVTLTLERPCHRPCGLRRCSCVCLA